MKLIIQIPCFNEEETLPQTVADLPRSVEGFDVVEYLIIDDGSSDKTIEVAKQCGVHHIVSLGSNRGLAKAFSSGIEKCLELGADVVVNTDGDNQYCGADIEKLVQPVRNNLADIVVGCRPIADHPEFGVIKKILQIVGSWILRKISKTNVRDAPSGFRAFSRDACCRIFVYTRFSYCMETLIQAGNNSLRVSTVDIRVNKKTRDSRLFSSIPQYVWKQGMTMLSLLLLYRPVLLFCSLASTLFFAAFVLGIRFIYLVYFAVNAEPKRTYLPSLILLTLFASFGMMFSAAGIIAQLSRCQRFLSEEILYLTRKNSFKS